MVFKRREKQGWLEYLRGLFMPKKGWRRAIEYVGHRVKRLPDTPHNIALGFSCGVFVSFSPIFGLHFIYAAICAMILRANVLASLLGTFFGNPLTFVFIGPLCYSIGSRLLGLRGGPQDEAGLAESFKSAFAAIWQGIKAPFGYGQSNWYVLVDFFSDVFVPYFLGGLAPGFMAAGLCYFLTLPLIRAYQNKRRQMLINRTIRTRAKIIPGADAAE